MTNIHALETVLQHIENNPEQWDQGSWRSRCGTAYCFAGWATQLAGLPWASDDATDRAWSKVMQDGETVWCDAAAQKILDLNTTDADLLFDGCNTLPDLRNLVAEFIAEQKAADRQAVDELVHALESSTREQVSA